MPVMRCAKKGKSGYRYGKGGFCYTFSKGNEASRKRAKQKAYLQGAAIKKGGAQEMSIADKVIRRKIFGDIQEAVWSAKYVNDLPDSAFFYITPGGKKDASGKTVLRSLRKLPYKDKNGKIDLPHLRNAIARIPQAKGISAATKKRLQAKARRFLARQK